ncbi:MAG TPA: LuxR C-terminal-related transcriptional regulator [Thermoanaerobaculia bacterium]|nr:LuxR C-terminal-related transcriptional regulator [Thermoanaerobaculia bacterium]
MPRSLIDAVPFSAPRDADLEALVATLGAALAPDAFELVLLCPSSGRRFRRRLAGGRDSGLRLAPASRNGGLPNGNVLTVPFGEEGGWRGRLYLVRRRFRPWTGAESMRFSLLAPLACQLLTRLAEAPVARCAQERLLALAEATEAPAMILDRGGTILYANGAAEELLSREAEEGPTVLSGDRRAIPLVPHLLQLAGREAPATERIALTDGRCLEARIVDCPGDGTSVAPPARIVLLKERAAPTIDDVRPHLAARGVSDREAEVVSGVLRGLRNSEIAGELFISEYTVKDHLKHAFRKLSVASRGELLRALHAVPGRPPARVA